MDFSLNYGVTAIIVGIIILVIAQAVLTGQKKTGQRKFFTWLGIIVIAVIGLTALVIPTSTFGVWLNHPLTGNNVTYGNNTLYYSVSGQNGNIATSSGYNSCGQNPVINPLFVDQLTQLSITSSIMNVKDKVTSNLLGPLSVASGVMTPSLANGQVITPIVNASGYINEIQPDYQAGCGSQNIQGNLYAFSNETVQVYNNLGTSTITTALNTTNETAFTTQSNNKIHLVGNAFKSTGKMYVVYEVANTTSVQSSTLSPISSGITVTPISSIPNCYTNKLSGTPYKMAWEVSPLIGATVGDLNLNTQALNGLAVSGLAYLSIFNEQDGIDSLNGQYLTSGICDSNNRFFGVGAVLGSNGAPASTSTLNGQVNSWNIK